MNVLTQHFYPDGLGGNGLVGVTRVELTSTTAETLTMPFMSTTNGVAQLRCLGDAAVTTITASDNTTVSITAATTGQKATFVTHHPRSSSGTQVDPGTPTVD